MDNIYDVEWDRYLTYLKEWANSHNSYLCKGMSPACFDEWLMVENEEYVDDESEV